MESVELIYMPKDSPVSYQEIQRPSGFTARFIHMHDLHEICFIPSPSMCQIFSGGNRWTVRGPAIILHRAGSYHELLSVSPEGAPYDSRLIYFRTEGLPEVFLPQQLLANDCLILPLDSADIFTPYFDLLKAEPGQRKQLTLLLILSRMAQEAAAAENAIRGNASESYLFDVIRFLREHLSEPITVKLLAQRFHISESKLKRDFSTMTGLPVKRFVTELRLRQACALLRGTEQDIAAIAYQLGFSGESHFIEVFRTHLGITPGKYRKSEEYSHV